MIALDNFTRHYLIAALWSSNDESDDAGGEPMDRNYDIDDIAPEAIEKAKADCAAFIATAGPHLLNFVYQMYDDGGMSEHPDAGSAEACAGHDFWLTRNHHGAGFWDRGFGVFGDQLTGVAQHFPETDLYVGDDGKLYFM